MKDDEQGRKKVNRKQRAIETIIMTHSLPFASRNQETSHDYCEGYEALVSCCVLMKSNGNELMMKNESENSHSIHLLPLLI